MIKNYFKIAFRGFWRHKLFTLINIIGLSIGISAALVIYLIVHFDFTFDKFHKDDDRIYRVVSNFTSQGESNYNGGVAGPVPEVLKSKVTGVEFTAPVFILSYINVFVNSKEGVPVRFKNQDNIAWVDANYFKIFSYKWLAGSAKDALIEPNKTVLTSEQAKKYFPKLAYNQMIGQTVTYDTIKTTVTGIVQTPTQNTDLTFRHFISYSTATAVANKSLSDQLQLNQWESTNSSSQVFIKLLAKASPTQVTKQLNDIHLKSSPPNPASKGYTHTFVLQQLSDLHFNSNYGIFDASERGAVKKSTMYGLLIIAAFLLILGCINFINLTTAQATQRAKEIGIRKTMGSTRGQLTIQFLSETFLVTLVAIIISMLLTPVILKLFADFIPSGVKADFFQFNILIFLLLLTLGVSLASGFYPAMMLSAYRPVTVLKNQSLTDNSQTRNAWLRKSLTVTQFIIAQFFIMATVLVSKQIHYALNKDMGFKKDAIITIALPWKNRTPSRDELFFNKLRALPQVAMVSVGGASPSSGGYSSTDITYKDGKKEIKTDVQLKMGDENYMALYNIKLVAGRTLVAGDSTTGVVINQTCAKTLGFIDPHNAIGKTLSRLNKIKTPLIVGVAADFHQASLRTPIKPILISISNKYQKGVAHIALKPETAGRQEWKTAITAMEKTWKGIYPDDDFDYHFVDETIAKFYKDEQHTSTLLTWAMGLSILISCLGLLGLAIYTTNQRTKEIGVRKVLGASVTQIVTLLSKELVWLILLAFVVVTPIAWWAMNKWMQSFADHTPISWWIFALSGAGMLLAAIITSSFQTVKAAVANPVKSLRSE
ncbi:MAG TPA: ABC transporter permease [Mucilaginibacter sp.]